MLKYLDRLKKFDYLVRHSMTGSPKECAEKLEISRSRFYEFLEDLKLMDIPVEYDKNMRSYTYQVPGKLVIGFEKKTSIIDERTLNQLKGGIKHYLLESYQKGA